MMPCVTEVGAFDPGAVGPQFVYLAVADHIAARIAAGELAPGAPLADERDLAAEYEVSVVTGHQAIGLLRSRGLVVTLPGKGSYVTGPRA